MFCVCKLLNYHFSTYNQSKLIFNRLRLQPKKVNRLRLLLSGISYKKIKKFRHCIYVKKITICCRVAASYIFQSFLLKEKNYFWKKTMSDFVKVKNI